MIEAADLIWECWNSGRTISMIPEQLIPETRREAYAIQSHYVWMKHPSKLQGHCYEVDTETGGQKYSNKVNKLICRPANTVHFWIGEKSKLKGQCYEADPETRGEK